MTCEHVIMNPDDTCERCGEIVDSVDAWDGICSWCDHGIDFVSADRWSFRDGLREVTFCPSSPCGLHIPMPREAVR